MPETRIRAVTVEWFDCTSADLVMTPEEASEFELIVMHSTGNFVCENKKFICIGRDWIPEQESFRDLQWIPKVNVIKVIRHK
jgi:hypothetical protein